MEKDRQGPQQERLASAANIHNYNFVQSETQLNMFCGTLTKCEGSHRGTKHAEGGCSSIAFSVTVQGNVS